MLKIKREYLRDFDSSSCRWKIFSYVYIYNILHKNAIDKIKKAYKREEAK
jgi:hypothetical protein